MFEQNLDLKPGARWMLLTRNGKLILEPGEAPNRWTARFLFASKTDMLLDMQQGLRANRCANRIDWSIEKHSILVGRLMEIFYPDEEWGALGGLFHDAHEAYMGDIPSPVGATLQNSGYIKDVIDDAVADYLDFDFTFSRQKVHICDQLAWDLESAEFLAFSPNDPFLMKHYPDLVTRKRMGLHRMVKGHAPEIETVVHELIEGRHTLVSEYKRLTTWVT